MSRTDSGAILTVTATRTARERSDDERWHKRERVSSTVTRSILLPTNVDLQALTSKLEFGVLHIAMRKLPAGVASDAPRRIPIA